VSGDGDESCRHPRGDYEGLAAAFEKYLRERPEFAQTRVLYRMNHMGWTWQEEDQEALDQARAEIAKDPAKVDRLTRLGIWPPSNDPPDTASPAPHRPGRPARA
jgi:hypothetical protein